MAAARNPKSDVVPRCPACGHPLEGDTQSACSLCGFGLADRRATGDDVTPYALAHAEGNRAWWRMCKWVWGATTERLKHLALMRRSSASRRFAAINILLLAFATMVLELSYVGWHVASAPLGEGVEAIKPTGKGWLHVESSRQVAGGAGKRVDVWWNPAQAIIASVASFVAALLMCLLLLWFIRALIERMHSRAYRGEQRMTAALSYSTAWIVPALPAAAVIAFLPLASIGAFGSEPAIVVLAAIIVALPAVLWWVWLIRLGAMAPTESRSAVHTTFVVGIPLFAAAAIAGWWFGLRTLLEHVFPAIGLNF